MAVNEEVKVKAWWLNTTYACGCIETRDGVIVGACPIYRKLIGRRLDSIVHWSKVRELELLEEK